MTKKGKGLMSVPVEGLPRTVADKPRFIYYICPRCGSEMRLHSSYVVDNTRCECPCGYAFLARDELVKK